MVFSRMPIKAIPVYKINSLTLLLVLKGRLIGMYHDAYFAPPRSEPRAILNKNHCTLPMFSLSFQFL